MAHACAFEPLGAPHRELGTGLCIPCCVCMYCVNMGQSRAASHGCRNIRSSSQQRRREGEQA